MVEVWLTFVAGRALLPRLMETCTRPGFRILGVKADRLPGRTDPAARLLLELEGTADTGRLASEPFHHDGVIDVEMTAAAGEWTRPALRRSCVGGAGPGCWTRRGVRFPVGWPVSGCRPSQAVVPEASGPRVMAGSVRSWGRVARRGRIAPLPGMTFRFRPLKSP